MGTEYKVSHENQEAANALFIKVANAHAEHDYFFHKGELTVGGRPATAEQWKKHEADEFLKEHKSEMQHQVLSQVASANKNGYITTKVRGIVSHVPIKSQDDLDMVQHATFSYFSKKADAETSFYKISEEAQAAGNGKKLSDDEAKTLIAKLRKADTYSKTAELDQTATQYNLLGLEHDVIGNKITHTSKDDQRLNEISTKRDELKHKLEERQHPQDQTISESAGILENIANQKAIRISRDMYCALVQNAIGAPLVAVGGTPASLPGKIHENELIA